MRVWFPGGGGGLGGRSLGGGNGNSLQHSCLENPTDRGAWWATIHRVTNSWRRLKWLNTQHIQLSHFPITFLSLWTILLTLFRPNFMSFLYIFFLTTRSSLCPWPTYFKNPTSSVTSLVLRTLWLTLQVPWPATPTLLLFCYHFSNSWEGFSFYLCSLNYLYAIKLLWLKWRKRRF